MRSWFANLLKTLFGDSIARALGGASLSLATAGLLIPLVSAGMNAAVTSISGVPGDILNVALLMGFGEAISIIGAAMLTRIYVNSGSVGLRRSTGA